ncbi:transmembrane protein, putative (macronuclear) [Tetrahymena thermophila SB210]|uniref:Transmembrane protein, putative n=1 Tax=Tetrahymena thermophila (strain SB210) TaxID=312017 RepID=W7WX19_TETTS|nr:transmembrane protein, putative [Tetrahymena thermophila SB210]EWS71340.1 transmembrane protein, putative [Tetrahymena thermophila SB210]|eukprot:XP_012656114.1 transmembrane protein, putative [Tetrahymena thermophila SB210]
MVILAILKQQYLYNSVFWQHILLPLIKKKACSLLIFSYIYLISLNLNFLKKLLKILKQLIKNLSLTLFFFTQLSLYIYIITYNSDSCICMHCVLAFYNLFLLVKIQQVKFQLAGPRPNLKNLKYAPWGSFVIFYYIFLYNKIQLLCELFFFLLSLTQLRSQLNQFKCKIINAIHLSSRFQTTKFLNGILLYYIQYQIESVNLISLI